MKTLMKILFILTAFLSSAAHSNTPITQIDIDRMCSGWAELAELIMERRQAGMPLADMLVAVGDNELARSLTIDAYNQTRYSSENVRERVTREFSNELHLLCLKNPETFL